MRRQALTVALTTLLLASCTQQGVGSVVTNAGDPPPSAGGITNATETETAVKPLDFTSCQGAVNRVRDWAETLLLTGGAFKTIVDLSGPAIPFTFPDERTMDAGEDLFNAAEIYTRKLQDLDRLLQSLVTVAGNCRDSDAFIALPKPCSQAVIAALEPERSRPSLWLDPGLDYVDTLLNTMSTWLSSGFRLTSSQRSELASAERRALGLHEEMLDEAAHIRELTISCRI